MTERWRDGERDRRRDGRFLGVVEVGVTKELVNKFKIYIPESDIEPVL